MKLQCYFYCIFKFVSKFEANRTIGSRDIAYVNAKQNSPGIMNNSYLHRCHGDNVNKRARANMEFLPYFVVRFSWFCFDFTHLSRPNRLANFLVTLPATLSKHFSFEWYKFCQWNFKELWLVTSVNWYTFWCFLKILKSRLYNHDR